MAVVVAFTVPRLPFVERPIAAAAGTIIAYGANGMVYLVPVEGDRQVASLVLAARVRETAARESLDPSALRLSVTDASWNPVSNLFVADSALSSLSGDPNPRSDAAISYYRSDGVQDRVRFVSTTQEWSDVSVSPRGDQFAVTVRTLGDTDGTSHVTVLDDHGIVRKLPSTGSGPIAWSADGRELAYRCYPAGSPQPCIDTGGSPRAIATPGLTDVQDVSLSPDGKTLAFTATNGQPSTDVVATIDLDDGRIVSIDADLTSKTAVTYDPSGHWLAYVAGGQLRINNLQTGVTTTTMSGLTVDTLSWTSDPLSEFGLS